MSDEKSWNEGGRKRRKSQVEIDDELSGLLIDMENEPVPERLLQLAMKLQTALALKGRNQRDSD